MFNWKEAKIIEPCCGKGAFLIGLYKVYKKKNIIQKFYDNVSWFDINPINV